MIVSSIWRIADALSTNTQGWRNTWVSRSRNHLPGIATVREAQKAVEQTFMKDRSVFSPDRSVAGGHRKKERTRQDKQTIYNACAWRDANPDQIAITNADYMLQARRRSFNAPRRGSKHFGNQELQTVCLPHSIANNATEWGTQS